MLCFFLVTKFIILTCESVGVAMVLTFHLLLLVSLSQLLAFVLPFDIFQLHISSAEHV